MALQLLLCMQTITSTGTVRHLSGSTGVGLCLCLDSSMLLSKSMPTSTLCSHGVTQALQAVELLDLLYAELPAVMLCDWQLVLPSDHALPLPGWY
ncbi:MAG: hypothetical protein FRX49_12107 [Trebouxia sp. A1-2]|nr:MAG: hypothetical protein FRX49_12107 [Trebouxia sp. A1-2]